MSDKEIGSALVAVWSIARIAFWWKTRRGAVRRSAMTPRRSALLTVVSLSLLPTYLYYFTTVLDRFRFGWPTWVNSLGNAVLAAAIALFIWSHAALGSAWTARVDIAEGQQLVTRGPYRWVRHPMYTSLLLLCPGLMLATGNLLVALPYSVAIVTMYLDRVEAEEELMMASFGREYHNYMSRTGRLLPRVFRSSRNAR